MEPLPHSSYSIRSSGTPVSLNTSTSSRQHAAAQPLQVTSPAARTWSELGSLVITITVWVLLKTVSIAATKKHQRNPASNWAGFYLSFRSKAKRQHLAVGRSHHKTTFTSYLIGADITRSIATSASLISYRTIA